MKEGDKIKGSNKGIKQGGKIRGKIRGWNKEVKKGKIRG